MKIQCQRPDLIVFESELFRTTSSLVIGADYLLLIDPNWLPGEIEFIHQTVEAMGSDKKKYLLFTHSDYDHIIGYGKFKCWTTIASENFVLNDDKKNTIAQINDFDDQYYIQRNYPIVYPEIDIIIKDDSTQLQIGSDEYFFYQAVGHNKDGLITLNTTKNILIVGDYLSNVEFPYVYESFTKYQDTLRKLQKIIANDKADILISGHGDYTGSKTEMENRIKDAFQYIHQLEDALSNKKDFDLEALFKKYQFPKIMLDFHQKNWALLKKEREGK